MLFVSFDYFTFLLLVLVIYWLIPSRSVNYRALFLVLANLVYYTWWDWRFSLLLLTLSGIAFIAGILIAQLPEGKIKKRLLVVSLILIFSSLVFFKYFNFFISSFGQTLHFFGIQLQTSTLQVILPLGISFYTFQLAGYVLDIYWERSAPEKNPVIFLAFSTFFPLILSGPVERSTNLLKQLRIQAPIKWEHLSAGLKLILWGLFTKMVISDNLAGYVDTVYSDPSQHSSITLFYTSLLFMIQLYADFSGYSNIAIGSAKLLGFDLIKNFNLPFFSRSFSEFWRRWHISLTTWLFDYIFNPLNFSMRKIKKGGVVIALLATFLISGFWHGAAWTFVIWGILHGLVLSLEVILGLKKRVWSRFTNRHLQSFMSVASILFIFSSISLIAIFFKANSVKDAFQIIGEIFSFHKGGMFIGSSTWGFFLNVFFIFILFLTEFLQYKKIVSLNFSHSRLSLWIRWPAYAFLIFSIILYGKTDSAFIYFQF